MRNVRGDRLDDHETGDGGGGGDGGGTPGKVSLTSRMRRGPSADDIADKVVQRLARGSGTPLDGALRGRFEGSLGTDLGGVRVHTDGEAADAARDTGARAFAHGQDVYFGAGQYQPGTTEGQFLIAHEVAHTVQQQGAAPAPQFALETTQAGDVCEQEADSLAAAMVSGAPAGPVTRSPVQRIARESGRGIAESAGLAIADIDVILEQIAHRIVYHPAITDEDRTELARWGYSPGAITNLPGDLSFLTLRSARPGVAPVFAFKGTLELVDWIEDVNVCGVGMYQFSRNEAAIHAALEALGGNATLTGHSLGGALAQITCAMYPELVSRIVTFQAPGIDAELVAAMRRRPEGRRITARHHIVRGDAVSTAGEAHIPGGVIEHATTEEAIDPATAHRSMPLAEEASGAGVLDDVTGGPESWNSDTPRHAFGVNAMDTEDSSWGISEVVRRALGMGLADPTEEAYVVAWQHLRLQAASGCVRYIALQLECTAASEIAGSGLRENLDAMFPELRIASELEDRVRSGELGSAEAFIAAVAERVSLDETSRVRMQSYYNTILRDAGILDRLEDALDTAIGLAAGPMMPLRKATGDGGPPADAHAIAARGAAGAASPLPHLAMIQAAFGRHDVGGVAAHVGGEASAASEALGARAYAYGNDVVFDGSPDLHTAAHEAAHVVQQRGDVHLAGGVGAEGDPHERHADQVADAVVRGESAESLLDAYAPAGGAPSVQRAAIQRLRSVGHAAVGAIGFRLGNGTRRQLVALQELLNNEVGPLVAPTFSLSFELGHEHVDLVEVPREDAAGLLDMVTDQIEYLADRAEARRERRHRREVEVDSVDAIVAILEPMIATSGGVEGEATEIDLSAHIPMGPASVVVGLQLEVEHEEHGYHVTVEPQLGLGTPGGVGPVEEHADLLAGYSVEVLGHDAHTAAELIVNGIEHSLNNLLGIVGGVSSEDEERERRRGMTEHDFVETGVSLHGAVSEARHDSVTGHATEEASLEVGTTQRWRAEGEHGADALAYQTIDLDTETAIHGFGVQIEGQATLRTEALLPGDAPPPGEVTIRVFGRGRSDSLSALMLTIFQEALGMVLSALRAHDGAGTLAARAHAAENRAGMIGDLIYAGAMNAGAPPEFGLAAVLALSSAEPTRLTAQMEAEREVHLGVAEGGLGHTVEIANHTFE